MLIRARIACLAAAVLAAGTMGACVKNDCDGGSIFSALGNAWTEAELHRREQEDGPSVRWYWCEAPMDKGDPVPAGKLGPIVNLQTGADYGYGAWVKVLADDVKVLHDGLVWADVDRVGAVATKSPRNWALAAGAVFYTMSAADLPRPILDRYEAREVAFFVKKHGQLPSGIECYSVAEVREFQRNWEQCKVPARKSPVTQSEGASSSTGSSGPTGDDWGTD